MEEVGKKEPSRFRYQIMRSVIRVADDKDYPGEQFRQKNPVYKKCLCWNRYMSQTSANCHRKATKEYVTDSFCRPDRYLRFQQYYHHPDACLPHKTQGWPDKIQPEQAI